jgi:diguanylate cyclase (GGDEF)-like protein
LLKAEDNKDSLALLFLDVDRFKNINDTLGHTVGDIMLEHVSKRLAESLPALKVYRIGGDEFTLILPKSSRDEALQAAEIILQQFETPYEINEHSFFLTASIGIGMYPFDGDDMDSLVANADTAMYQAKASGNRVEFYTKEMNRKLSRAIVVEKELRKALNNQQLEVYYQPKINLRSNHIVGFEALLRWNHPTLGWISPVEFIPLAEDNGLILPTEWVLRTASHFVKTLQEGGYPSLHISVNLSPWLFQREDLIEMVADVLLESGVSRSLQLEITESVMKDHQRALMTLNKMKALGIQIAVDDFGTGYSSLNYLTQFPIDTLKIDQSFIKNIKKFECAAIVKTIIDMAHHLNLNVIAEGVETIEQLQFLCEQHCVEAQGFYFSKPIPQAEVKGWMLKKR